jgi:ribosome-associated translation inhibitor RaiA
VPRRYKEKRMIPTDITFHGLDHSDAVEAAVGRWVERLEHFYDRIAKCTVVLQQPHRRHRHGSEFEITIVLEMPGPDITVSHRGDSDIYVAVADAFRATRRQLLDRLDMRQNFVKTHVVERTGSVGVNVDKHRL